MSSGVGVRAGEMELGYRVPSLLTSRDPGLELAGVWNMILSDFNN